MSEIAFLQLKEISVTSLDEFHQAALELSKEFSPKTVIALSGQLGVGKTEFVKTIAKARGFQDVASPTFAIHHRYQGISVSIDHLDLYRLADEDELETTGFWDFFSEPEGLIMIEWPERMKLEHIPYDWDLFLLEISIDQNSKKRTLKLFRRA